MSDVNVAVTASLVAENDRLAFLPRFCNHLMVFVETSVYSALSTLSEGVYRGAYWEFYTLSNGSFYMAPRHDEGYRLVCAGNGFEGHLSADACGVVATLFGLNRVVSNFHDEQLIERYYELREFALGHPESALIMACID